MTIERGREWGHPVSHDVAAVSVADDAALADLLSSTDRPMAPTVRLREGDLARTLGGGSEATSSGEPWLLPVDALRLRLTTPDGTDVEVPVIAQVIAVDRTGRRRTRAHRSVRSTLFRTHSVVVANAAFVGDWNIAPRAHPGDGLLDVLEGVLPRRELHTFRRRVPVGTHVPHPSLASRRGRVHQLAEGAWWLWADGRALGPVTTATVEVVPHAVRVLR